MAASLMLSTFLAAAGAQTSQPRQAPPAPVSQAQFARELATAQPGQVVQTCFDQLAGVPRLTLTLKPSANAARLIFSDRPEYFRAGDGIASQDKVDGGPETVRYYTYHVPVLKDGKPRRVLTIFENLGDREATLKFTVHSEPKPSGDYNAMAKQAMSDWFSEHGKGETVKIPPHGYHLADGSEPIDKPDLLVHGLFEFTTDQPLLLTVAQVTATDDLKADVQRVSQLPKLPMLPYGLSKNKANRGNFPNADIDGSLKADYDTAQGPAQLIVADGKTDPWQNGTDGISGDATINQGNYGVAYHLKLNWKSSDGRGVAVLLSPPHYDFTECGAAAAAVKVSDGLNRGGVIELPSNAIRFHGIPEACVIQTFGSAESGNGPIDLTFTPPGACCLPMPILLVPIDK